ncbi:hypothetical protein BCU78_11320 [Vibrio lentus]|nr:hypothetical protein BCU78_11320 [Vibrio lentus]
MLQAQEIELRLLERVLKGEPKSWYLGLLGKLIVTSTWLLQLLEGQNTEKPWQRLSYHGFVLL